MYIRYALDSGHAKYGSLTTATHKPKEWLAHKSNDTIFFCFLSKWILINFGTLFPTRWNIQAKMKNWSLIYYYYCSVFALSFSCCHLSVFTHSLFHHTRVGCLFLPRFFRSWASFRQYCLHGWQLFKSCGIIFTLIVHSHRMSNTISRVKVCGRMCVCCVLDCLAFGSVSIVVNGPYKMRAMPYITWNCVAHTSNNGNPSKYTEWAVKPDKGTASG